ncbi:alanine--tRNA ligase [Candidatus Saganbacteria bacterium]|uniref:Alanine--tRNA ligase n=1 Tax=Candidatus Saganbacteria bacterium TaxID=2575572 RepID=A0A9D6ULJ5_UNCSA|nr:alanine--tRNA ligase [Candidatus Saganbacteria bacterium]
MKSSEIREVFLKFFEAKGHKILPGSSLIPADPTVLLTLAGMLQLKTIFLGQEKPAFRRVCTVQKCLRMNDVGNVGRTLRHHTFFEMLGNFSFGDYFKKEAILFAWELLTEKFGLPLERLKIAVYEKDDEAFEIWRKEVGLPEEIIFRLGEDNNFWAAGATGPCGPCSEIYYDLGPEEGCGKPDCSPGCDCDRFLEIWNLVFIQYNRNEAGALLPLQQKGIDTGMGLERIASVLQVKTDNFERDIFVPLIKKIKTLLSTPEASGVSVKIIADHIRAVVHLISDGVFPENTGRGYVLRRLIRRAVCRGKLLGIERPFLHELSHVVASEMGSAYPLLAENEAYIAGVIEDEENNFFATLTHGMKWLEDVMAAQQLLGRDKRVSGAQAFRLHDTYGFPIELTAELAGEKGIEVDLPGFEKEMERQRRRARSAGLDDRKKLLFTLNLNRFKTEFVGYDKTSASAKVLFVYPEANLVILDKTPFYAESGGQVGDRGIIVIGSKELRVTNTLAAPGGAIIHEVPNNCWVDDARAAEGAKARAIIDGARRRAIEAHHTATHLLHKGLREVLGGHVKQAGSYVGPDKLRFDFRHSRGLSQEELQKVEQIVNQKIKEKNKVEVLLKSYPEALKMGATALFGEKYGDQVRVIKIGDYSLELCGGAHVKNTSDLLFFKIVSEGALGSGVRRIEALAGQAAKIHVIYQAKSLSDQVSELIKKYRSLQMEKEELGGEKIMETNIFEVEITELESITRAVNNYDAVSVNKFLDHLCGRVEWLKERVAKTEKEIEDLKKKKTRNEAAPLISEAREIGEKKVLLRKFDACDMEGLRTISDTLQAELKSCVLLLASAFPKRTIYLITVTEDLAAAGVSAKGVAEVFSKIVGGKGGGKETKVEGGGKYPERIEEGFEAVVRLLGGSG